MIGNVMDWIGVGVGIMKECQTLSLETGAIGRSNALGKIQGTSYWT